MLYRRSHHILANPPSYISFSTYFDKPSYRTKACIKSAETCLKIAYDALITGGNPR